jgi:hypothetical protein
LFPKSLAVLRNCRVYYKNEDWRRFDEQMKALNPRFTSGNPAFNRDHLFRYYRNFAIPFTPFSEPERHLLEERLGLAEESSQKLCYELRKWLHGIAWNQLLEDQFFAIKEQWASVFYMFSAAILGPIKARLGRLSTVAEALCRPQTLLYRRFRVAGADFRYRGGHRGNPPRRWIVLPHPKGDRPLKDYRRMANGSKWHVLQNMLVGDCFSELSGSALRNGIGHNAAHYVVQEDAIQYRNEPKNAPAITGEIGYTRFCAKLLALFRQWEWLPFTFGGCARSTSRTFAVPSRSARLRPPESRRALPSHLANPRGRQGKPFLALILRDKLPIVLKQHYRAVASLQGDLGGALCDRHAVGAE